MRGRELMTKLDELVEKRRKGELDARAFYKELLNILSELVTALKEEEIADSDITLQIPLLLTFLYDQLDKLEKREE